MFTYIYFGCGKLGNNREFSTIDCGKYVEKKVIHKVIHKFSTKLSTIFFLFDKGNISFPQLIKKFYTMVDKVFPPLCGKVENSKIVKKNNVCYYENGDI